MKNKVRYLFAVALIASGAYFMLVGDSNKTLYSIAQFVLLICGGIALFATREKVKNKKITKK